MHPSNAIAYTYLMVMSPWAAFMVAPHVYAEMCRLYWQAKQK